VAREFPTPIPTPAPTPVPTKQPTPIPTPVPTKIPETKKSIQPIKTPDIPTPTATIPPVSSPTVVAGSTASPESDFTPVSLPRSAETTIAKPLSKSKNAEPNSIEKTEPKDAGGAEEQQQKELLKKYLQEVATKIHAVKRYPRQARRKGWEGTVVIKLSILPTGDVEQALLVKSSQHKALDEAAFQAIAKAQPFPRFSEKLTLSLLTVKIPIQFVLGE
jgi:protein TonB